MKQPLKTNVATIYTAVRRALRSRRGRDVLTYMAFLAVAFVFWVFMSLDREVQREFEVPLELTEVPDSITFITPAPHALNVSVKGKGSQLLRFLWGNAPVMRFKWADNNIDGKVFISSSRLDTRLREYFGTGSDIVSCRPDSLCLPFTSMPGKRMKLTVQADITPDLQYIIAGPIEASTDSVTLYTATRLPRDLKTVLTEPLIASGLRDTTAFELKVKPIPGVRIIPDHITVRVPVEPLIARRRTVNLEAQGVPQGKHLVTFPSRVDISYLVPMSHYNDELPIRAYVDYNEVHNPGNKLTVHIPSPPAIYSSVLSNPDMVEYIIEEGQ